MENEKSNPLFPRIEVAEALAVEAEVLFEAIVLAEDVTGEIPTGLRLMLEKRLRLIKENLTVVVKTYDMPF